MSARTGGAAVAVSARIGGRPRLARRGREAQVLGPEVMAPLRHAVRLVDDEERRLRGRQALGDLVVRQLLGREEHELDASVGEALEDALALAVRQRGVQGGRAAAPDAGDGLHLVLLQGDERRHHDRRAVEEQAGDLVDRRLAGSRGHDGEGVLPVQHRGHRLELPGPQLVVARAARGRRHGCAGRPGSSLLRPILDGGWRRRRHAPRRIARNGCHNSAVPCPTVPASTSSATRKGTVIYVGKAKSIRKRVAAHFSNPATRGARDGRRDRPHRVRARLQRGRGAAGRAELHQAVQAALQRPAARRQVLSVHRDLDGRGVPARLLHARAPSPRPRCTSARTPTPRASAARSTCSARSSCSARATGPSPAGAAARRAWTTTSSAAARPASATSPRRSTASRSTASSTSSPAATARSSATSRRG